MLNPQFPYKSNQIILSSDRVLLHAKSDGVFLFGKQMVALASNGTVNIDAVEKILLDSNKIELGTQAELKGEPVVLGKKVKSLLYRLLDTLEQVGLDLQRVSKSGDASSWLVVKGAGHDIENICSALKFEVDDPSGPNYILSNTTFTR
jgi:hypothetical protein